MDKDRMSASAAECVREIANWSGAPTSFRFDAVPSGLTRTAKAELEEQLPIASPKLEMLFRNIEKLDAKDQKRHGKRFKHMVFTDVRSNHHGAKLVATAFEAKGYARVMTPGLDLDPARLRDLRDAKGQRGNGFALLCSSTVYKRTIPARYKKELIRLYNQRPDNVHGELIRFIILDQGYKEGIDLYDIKYVHLLEPLLTPADEMQAIGRGTRYCGQKGLPFHPERGWPLYVYRYDLSIPEGLKEGFQGASTLGDLAFRLSGKSAEQIRLLEEMDRAVQEAAVDYPLTRAIHGSDLLKGKAARASGGDARTSSANRYKPLAPITRKDHLAMRTFIINRFAPFAWPKAAFENICVPSGGMGNDHRPVELTPSQEFLRRYFTPASWYKGLLMYHLMGTGKTCSAIAIASTTWERQGYSILWVTRHTLRADMWKNMYDAVCSDAIREGLETGRIRLPEGKVQSPRRYLSDAWLPPISYRQFSNLLAGKNELYKELVRRNGKPDPLRRTLVIMDEAHKLFSDGLRGPERPDLDLLKEMVHHSYDKSGDESVRLLLLTATPFNADPMDLCRILNLLRPKEIALPEDMDGFHAKYLNEKGRFTERGRSRFMDDISGYVSYLNRQKDARAFAYPIMEEVTSPLSESTIVEHKKELEEAQEQLHRIADDLDTAKASKKRIAATVEMERMAEMARCEALPTKAERAACKRKARAMIAEYKKELAREIREQVKDDKEKQANFKRAVREAKKKVAAAMAADVSTERGLRDRCEAKK